jgi:transcriptional regulator with PAS, ATPase and Fis domain
VTRDGFLDATHLTLERFESSDHSMVRCLQIARAACQTELPILILGESGTGKTLLAQAIHNTSRRAGAPFVAFNAAALSDTLLDSQLFGHEKGAFTDAKKQLRGKFEIADGGTLFIDEIADMSQLAQAKILRAVEYGEYERLGSERLYRADVRLISATRYPLAKFADTDQFRSDLFFRIAGLTITLPPLRERPIDLRALVAASIRRAAQLQGRTISGLSQKAADMLFSYDWPGNLRELDLIIHAAVAMTSGEVIEETAVLIQPREGRERAQPAGPRPREGDKRLRAVEREHILRVLADSGGNKTKAAQALGISRSRLARKLADSE